VNPHNQTKELTNWFLNLPLDESIDNTITKFEVRIQDPMKHSRRPKKPRKAQEGHLEDVRQQKPTKGTKSGKAKQNGKEQLKINTEAQKSKKISKSIQNSKSTLPLKSTPPNTLNASSPPEIVIYHVSSLNHPVSKRVQPTLCPYSNQHSL
jgi:hypothetical protein